MTRGWHPLEDGLPEPWATEWGEDRFGVFMGFTVGDVEQRMRWIPPGSFMMGSPEGEAGRFDEREVPHSVRLTSGYWLADTPCTQALWHAVMGKNPSRFVSPGRPVEQVSWDECQSFCEELNKLVPTLGARLPTEAEWEHACRAGTETATWAGDLEIKGERHAPVLDAIAWYGGNSGYGFELGNGYDSSSWPEKHYPHEQAGTRAVRQKQPNPWGLFDMLGNVLEWCEDWYTPYASDAAVDPQGPVTGSLRVLRGGCWNAQARHVRAAYRNWLIPASRLVLVGFRLARGRGPVR